MTNADYPSPNGASDRAWSQSFQRLVVLGYILAVAMPPVGFVLGIVVAVRGARVKSRHGMLIIPLSVIAAVAWVAILASGALTTPDQNF